jgi:predicted alpha/beta superfamily hydrolase
MRKLLQFISGQGLLFGWLILLPGGTLRASAQAAPAPLCIGETFTVASKVLGETRRLNVYVPPVYRDSATVRLPVLYMPDGGLAEDFLHVAGLVQVLVGNGAMRPFILVGIENTQRRRDLTGSTTNADDKKIAPRVGGSAAFRQFIRRELMPAVRQRYRTTPETALMGESLAGLFTVETLLLEPDLFDTYLALDPSLWWNNGQLARQRPRQNPVPSHEQPGRHGRHAAASQPGAPAEPTPHHRLLRAAAHRNARYHLPPRRPAGPAAGTEAGSPVSAARPAPALLAPTAKFISPTPRQYAHWLFTLHYKVI